MSREQEDKPKAIQEMTTNMGAAMILAVLGCMGMGAGYVMAHNRHPMWTDAEVNSDYLNNTLEHGAYAGYTLSSYAVYLAMGLAAVSFGIFVRKMMR